MSDVLAAYRAGFVAGFMASGQGWNGEFPYKQKNRSPEGEKAFEDEFTAASLDWYSSESDPLAQAGLFPHRWTQDLPTKPGHYWAHMGGDTELLEVWSRDGKWYSCLGERSMPLADHRNTVWLGPVAIPKP